MIGYPTYQEHKTATDLVRMHLKVFGQCPWSMDELIAVVKKIGIYDARKYKIGLTNLPVANANS